MGPEALIEHLVGMQAQSPLPPYFGLWTRLHDFLPDDLSRLLLHRRVVRIALMRSTIHLVTANDCLALRPIVQPVIDRALKGGYGQRLAKVDKGELAAVGRELVEERPRTFAELGEALKARWRDIDPDAARNAVRALVPLVQVPPRGLWGKAGRAAHTSAESWLGRSLGTARAADPLILRYLAAFGPATIADMRAWSGLTGLKDVVGRLRPRLRVFHDEGGFELFDVEDAPLPDGGIRVPCRFLPEWDNVLLAYANRTRIVAAPWLERLFTLNGIIRATFLVDGFVHGTWRLAKTKKRTTLVIEPYAGLTRPQQRALFEEGERLLSFAGADGAAGDFELAAAV